VREQLQRAQDRRQEVLQAIAVRQHEPTDALGALARENLGDRAAGVVGDDRHVLELERLEEVGDQVRDASR